MEIVKQLIGTNYKKGRGGRKIEMIVIHVMEGDLPSNITNPYTWFNNPAAKVSAHYGIDRDDKPVRQWVEEWNTAQHAGIIIRPTSKLVKKKYGINPNSYSIGIENEGSGKELPTAIQIMKNVELVRDICSRYGIPIDRDHIIGHNEIRIDKECPGMIDVDKIVYAARGMGDVIMMNKKLVFRRGDKNPTIGMLQKLLIATGDMTQEEVDTGPDRYGPRTEKAFQELIRRHNALH